MGRRDSKYMLEGDIEVDDAYYEIVLDKESLKTHPKKKQPKKGMKELKRGRGSDRQVEVMVIAESTPASESKSIHRPSRKFGHVKMIVMDNLGAAGINYEISKSVRSSAKITTDGWR